MMTSAGGGILTTVLSSIAGPPEDRKLALNKTSSEDRDELDALDEGAETEEESTRLLVADWLQGKTDQEYREIVKMLLRDSIEREKKEEAREVNRTLLVERDDVRWKSVRTAQLDSAAKACFSLGRMHLAKRQARANAKTTTSSERVPSALETADLFHATLRYDPKHGTAAYNGAISYFDAGQEKKALQLGERAAELGVVPAMRMLVAIYDQLGKPKKAKKWKKRADKLYAKPKDESPRPGRKSEL